MLSAQLAVSVQSEEFLVLIVFCMLDLEDFFECRTTQANFKVLIAVTSFLMLRLNYQYYKHYLFVRVVNLCNYLP